MAMPFAPKSRSGNIAMSDEASNPKRADARLDVAAGEECAVGHKKVDEINGFAGANASASSEAELAEVMTQAMAAAWNEVVPLADPLTDPMPLWLTLAKRIMSAAGEGERDPERLKRIALAGIEGNC